jgi:hypothetical protein
VFAFASRVEWAGKLAIVVFMIGCGALRAPQQSLPAFVDVEFRGALIGPSKFGGAAWDGLGRLDGSAQEGLAQALAAVDPHAAVLSFFTNPALAALERPEPFGHVRATVNGIVVQQLDLTLSQRDTLTPLWSNERLSRVPLVVDTRLEVELYDKDLVNDDAMGAATLKASDIAAALRVGTLHHVRVAGQTNNQVLFIDISVDGAP